MQASMQGLMLWGGQARQHHRLRGKPPSRALQRCRAGRASKAEAGPTQAAPPQTSQRASGGQGAASWSPAARLTPMPAGPTELPLCGCGAWGLLPVSLELTSCPPGHRG